MSRCSVADVDYSDVSLKQLGHDGHDHSELMLNTAAVSEDHGVLITVCEADSLLVTKIHTSDLRVESALFELVQHIGYKINDCGVSVVGLERLAYEQRKHTLYR